MSDNQYGNGYGAQQPIHITNTTVQKKGVNHFLHFMLTILTLGFWLPVWIIVAIAN